MTVPPGFLDRSSIPLGSCHEGPRRRRSASAVQVHSAVCSGSHTQSSSKVAESGVSAVGLGCPFRSRTSKGRSLRWLFVTFGAFAAARSIWLVWCHWVELHTGPNASSSRPTTSAEPTTNPSPRSSWQKMAARRIHATFSFRRNHCRSSASHRSARRLGMKAYSPPRVTTKLGRPLRILGIGFRGMV